MLGPILVFAGAVLMTVGLVFLGGWVSGRGERAGKPNAALSAWRVIDRLYRRVGVRGGFYHGHHDAGCARIHDAFNLIWLVRGQPDNRRTLLFVKHLYYCLNFT